ncbi:hypothetical protein DOY81_007204 [Sarcophaga bullata]|nr:hypothetical protein DOY81_007204 [Sarcophaga bullata]
MINSVNTLEFLKPKLITMDKFSSTTTTTKFLPPTSPSSYSPTRSFVTFGSHIINHNKTTIDLNKQQQQQQINGEIYHQEKRVKVQHVENHTKLQNNNCWNNFRTLCNNLSASSGIQNDNDTEHLTKHHHHIVNGDHDIIDVVNMEHSGIVKAETPITNIQNKSAFNLDLNKIKYHNNSIYINNDNNGLIRTEMNHQNNCDIKRKQQTPDTAKVIVERKVTIAPQRTEDQNKAYRHIESVHNYAKLKSYEDDDNDNQSPHGSRHSSYLDDEEDDEEEDDEEDNDEVDKEYDNGDYDERLELSNEEYPDVLYADYEDIINRRQRRSLQKLSTSSHGALFTRIHNSIRVEACAQKPTQIMQPLNVANSKVIKNINEDEEAHIDVDVETVETHSAIIPVAMPNSLNVAHHIADDSNAAVKPDHHARRPMNAFLIFCKRHRAIVKERYKNLENRAITKILGDWWASLDDNDKKCFTNLAQQNKDAFFSANPNFKWYKLPAPPLRTLTTRPANGFGQDYQEEKDVNVLETISNNTRSISHNSNSNYFKLADEAQMGDLSQLMEDKSKTTKQCADLQQALGETSQFMSAHITGTAETLEENSLKRRFYNENSFSSNSSEEDIMEPKKKSARSCKGKRYQELINSGQIVTAIKKSKSSTRLSGANDAVNSEMNLKQNFTNLNNNDNNFANNNICQKRSVSESDNILSYDLNGFDLEERIKELPALDLDEYLQRKRNTKKKKKFSANGKKRGQRNNNNANDINNKNNKSLQARQQMCNASHKNVTTTAVGSQKRKARKESITRRDISAIEQEVASLLPLTINGCCYFQEAPTTSKYMQSMEKDTKSTTSLHVNLSSEETSSTIIPLQSPASVDIFIDNTNTNIINNNNNNNNSSNNSNIINDNISSSTSDLLILAEVAANRTELKR